MRRILSYAISVRRAIASTILLQLAAASTYLVQGFLLAGVLDALAGGANLGDQAGRLSWLAGLVLVRAILLFTVEVVRAHTATATKVALRDRGFAHVAALGPGHLSGERSGELVATLVDGVEALEGYYAHYIPALTAGILAPIGAIIALGVRDPWLALLVAGFVVLAVVGPQLWLDALSKRSDERMSAQTGLGATVLDSLRGLTTLKAFGATDRRRDELAGMSDRLISLWAKEIAVTMVAGVIFSGAVIGGMAVAAWVAGVRVAEGGLVAGVGFLALLLSAEALRPIAVLAESFHTTYDSGAAVNRLDALFALEPPAPVRADPAPVAGLDAVIEFEDVTFTYPGSAHPAVSEFSLRIEPGETVAIVGASGSGKSTLVALLARFFDPDEGAVTIGGVDGRDLPLDQLRTSMAVVSQDTHLFTGTVRENLLMARPDADPAAIDAALRGAGAHEFVTRLPDGLDSHVGEHGGQLSGGQRQRLAIARALLTGAPILVLDEATASVDAATEADIQTALEAARAERTTLMIAHRLSTVLDADRIVVLDDGRTVETGTHLELMTAGGFYRQLVDAQAVDESEGTMP